jgi:cytoplasmic iron level regulating protein YaaA (DUF328/UPF0246 family)
VLILLPPSEGKAPTNAGVPFDLDRLSLPALNPTRVKVRDALVRLCGGRESRARQVLGLSERQQVELEQNRDLGHAHALPASHVYTGVLYEALSHASMTMAARRRADRSVLVSSALWGAVRLTDSIPSYRLSGDVRLPRLGPVTGLWRRPLAAAMQEAHGADGTVIFDLRSGVYAKMWSPDADSAPDTAVGRVLLQRPDGSRSVVSHHNKATKGRLVRALVSERAQPHSVIDLATAVERAGFVVELQQRPSGQPWLMDVVVDGV